MTHIHSWSVGEGGDAAVKTRQAADGRWQLLITDAAGTVLGRGPSDGFATEEAAQAHGEKLVGGFWHPVS
ncbi:MAG TPA: hypothetical protein VGB14_05140 [Acidimicrobiales bacterium]